jgi:hypothetical protein
LSALLHRSRPLYSAPYALRARVLQAAESFSPTTTHAAVRLKKRIATRLAWPFQAAGRGAHNWGALVATLFLIAAGFLLLPGIMQRSRANSYIAVAVAAHRSFLNGSLPLEVRSDLLSVVTAWFAGKVPFTFRLPNSAEESEHQQVYRLTGDASSTTKVGMLRWLLIRCNSKRSAFSSFPTGLQWLQEERRFFSVESSFTTAASEL